MAPVSQIRPLNRVQRIPELVINSILPIANDGTLGTHTVEDTIYTVPDGKKARVKGLFTSIDPFSVPAENHTVFIRQPGPTDVPQYRWVKTGGAADWFTPLLLVTNIGINVEFLLEENDILMHSVEFSTDFPRTHRIQVLLQIQEVPK